MQSRLQKEASDFLCLIPVDILSLRRRTLKHYMRSQAKQYLFKSKREVNAFKHWGRRVRRLVRKIKIKNSSVNKPFSFLHSRNHSQRRDLKGKMFRRFRKSRRPEV